MFEALIIGTIGGACITWAIVHLLGIHKFDFWRS